MREKEKWMFKGAIVNALGKKGVIKAMQENRLHDTDYVYYIDVQLEGQNYSQRYHPDDVQELVINPTK